MNIFKRISVSAVIISIFLGIGDTVNIVNADSIEQQSKLGIEQETDKQIIVKFNADLKLPYADKIGVLPDLKSILVNLGYEQREPNGGNELQVTENEPNNERRQANKVNFHTPMKGTLHNRDKVDVFTFQIDSPENINISLLNEQNIGMTWVLHLESDLNNYVAHGENEGNVVKGTYNAKPGKYYLYVYKYENKDGSYILNIK
ncbi:hypothetical protein IEO_03335 [Bacillus wiedmannii]|nr:hypothetical protein IEO_03335 [Bacillus wiedmannii]PFZ47103.1 hypothetical protein COL58_19160 [Bacillus wiedmannii]